MIKVELELSDIDYDSLIDQFLPVVLENMRQSDNPASRLVSSGMPASMARTLLKNLPQSTKDQLTVELINTNKEKIVPFLKDIAMKNSLQLTIGDVRASAVRT